MGEAWTGEALNWSNCSLCRLAAGEIITKVHYDDAVMLIVDCKTCKIPMIVFRDHRLPTEGEKRHMFRVAKELFPGHIVDTTRRTVPDHWHAHLRKPEVT